MTIFSNFTKVLYISQLQLFLIIATLYHTMQIYILQLWLTMFFLTLSHIKLFICNVLGMFQSLINTHRSFDGQTSSPFMIWIRERDASLCLLEMFASKTVLAKWEDALCDITVTSQHWENKLRNHFETEMNASCLLRWTSLRWKSLRMGLDACNDIRLQQTDLDS